MNIKANQKKNGFTLVETLIAIFIITLIGLAIVNFQIDIFSLNKISSDNLNAQTDARRALKSMTAELRSMSPSDNGSYALALVSTSSVIFYSNIDTDNTKEQIRYFQNDNILKKGVIKSVNGVYNPGTEVITSLVSNLANSSSSPIFYYYDKNYDGTNTALTYPINIPSIRLIKINIDIDKDITKNPAALNITTQVSLRNLKDNL
jgi:prepilin-type N-terminal cleavage/methylation domain-containing protein